MKKSEILYQHFLRALRNNEYCPGQKISESAVCREWKVSRGTVREAFARLAAEGFMEIRPKSGSYIRQKKPRDYIETLEVRAALERAALKNLIGKEPAPDTAKLRGLHQAMKDASGSDPFDGDKFQQAHQDFHRELVVLSGNLRLQQAFDQLPLEETGLFQPVVSEQVFRETLEEHERILTVIHDRDTAGPDWLEHLIRNKITYLNNETE